MFLSRATRKRRSFKTRSGAGAASFDRRNPRRFAVWILEIIAY
jgi:hypothetical protein